MTVRRSAGARAARALGASLAVGLAGTGCFRYVPVELSNVRPDQEVRVRLTNAAAARLVQEVGRYTTELEGQLSRDRSDSLALAVELGGALPQTAAARQVLFFGPSEVIEVRRRELSRSRTLLASAGALAAFVAIAAGVSQLGDPNPPEGDPPAPPPAMRPHLLRFSIP